jgi:predicted transcriptional regulator
MSAVSIRVDEPTHETLRELSKEWDEKISVLVAQAVKDLRRKKFMESLNAEYAALRVNPKAWEAETKERAAWDGTLLDGVDK